MILKSRHLMTIAKCFCFCFLLITASLFTAAQQKNYYLTRMNELHTAIEQQFYIADAGFYKETAVVEPGKSKYSYLWPLCALVQADNEIDALTGNGAPMAKTLRIIEAYYDPAPPAPGYASYVMKEGGGDRFYDDNQWIGIAALDAYERKNEASKLALGKTIYRYMMTGFDTVTGGGLYWQENKKTSKNTCSNGPGVLLALQLHKATKDKSYLDTALLLFNWTKQHLQAPNGLYYDNIGVKNGRVDKRMYSYNTGTMLQSNLYLYEVTNDKAYLREAIAMADSAVAYFQAGGNFRDSYWFNAVLLRGYQHLLKHNPDLRYIRAFKTCVDGALANNVNKDGIMGKNKAQDLVAQGGMLEILARLAYLEKKHNL